MILGFLLASFGSAGAVVFIAIVIGLAGWALVHGLRAERKRRLKLAQQDVVSASQPRQAAERDEVEDVIGVFRDILSKEGSWVLFRHGTCILVPRSEGDLQGWALNFLGEHGKVYVGSESADFGAFQLKNYPAWIVTYHYPEMMNYVSLLEALPGVLPMGMAGRRKRELDAAELQIIHVEDKKADAPPLRTD